jgi:hypothetical protein
MHFKTVYEAQGLKPPEKAKFVKRWLIIIIRLF